MEHPVETAIFVCLYFGLPTATVLIDRHWRRRRSGDAAKEPSMVSVLGWTILAYPAGMAYYFEQTRGTRLARYAGFGLGILYALVAFGAILALVVAKLET